MSRFAPQLDLAKAIGRIRRPRLLGSIDGQSKPSKQDAWPASSEAMASLVADVRDMRDAGPTDEIPKVIHYCWFGDRPLSERAQAAIDSWRRFMPEYRILCWNEHNFDFQEWAFSAAAYRAKKWAFVSDVARFHALAEQGGVYMDVGSHLIRSIEPLMRIGAFSARESGSAFVSPGLIMAAPADHPYMNSMVNSYARLSFSDDPTFLQEHTVNREFARLLAIDGYSSARDDLWVGPGFTVLPSSFFSPRLSFGGYRIDAYTYSIHSGSASWAPPSEQQRLKLIRILAPYTGDFLARKFARIATTLIPRGRK